MAKDSEESAMAFLNLGLVYICEKGYRFETVPVDDFVKVEASDKTLSGSWRAGKYISPQDFQRLMEARKVYGKGKTLEQREELKKLYRELLLKPDYELPGGNYLVIGRINNETKSGDIRLSGRILERDPEFPDTPQNKPLVQEKGLVALVKSDSSRPRLKS